MNTATKILTAYKAAKMLGKGDDLVVTEDDGIIEVCKVDATGENTWEWVITVDTQRKRQVPYLYIPRSGYVTTIRTDSAECYVIGVRNVPNYY